MALPILKQTLVDGSYRPLAFLHQFRLGFRFFFTI